MTRIPRRAVLAMALGILVFTGCSERSTSESADPEVLIPTATEQASPYPSVDGFMLGADERKVLLRTAEGERVFHIRKADLPAVGVEHLASHAGLTDVGFRVYYEEAGRRRYIKSSEEIPPPF